MTRWINTVCVEARILYSTGGFVQLDAIVGPTYVPGRTPCLSCYETPVEETRLIAGRGGTSSSVTEFTAALVADEIIRSAVLPIRWVHGFLWWVPCGACAFRPF